MSVDSLNNSPGLVSSICFPYCVCFLTISNSSAVSLPGFSRIDSGIISLPTSCIMAARLIFQLSSSLKPKHLHRTSVYSETRFTCCPVFSDLFSIIWETASMRFSWSSYNSLFLEASVLTSFSILSDMV